MSANVNERRELLCFSEKQEWVAIISRLTKEGDLNALDEAVDIDQSCDFQAIAGRAGDSELKSDEFDAIINAHTDEELAGLAVANVGRAIYDPRNRFDYLEQALTAFDNSNLHSIDVDADWFRTASSNDILIPLIKQLEKSQHHSKSFSFLLALRLMGKFPESASEQVRIPVVFQLNNSNEVGAAGHLYITRLVEGPPGLHADPRYMTFSRADGTFHEGVRRAWASSGLSESNSCYVWSIRLDGRVSESVVGESLSCAFAVGLNECRERTVLARSLRLRRLNHERAITGGLDRNGHLIPVEGYDAKLATAAGRNWSLVVPKKSETALEEYLSVFGERVDVYYANTVADAVKLAHGSLTRRARYLIVAIVVAFVALSSSSTFFVYRHIQVQRANDRVLAASQLISLADQRRGNDPRTSALAAFAAYRLNPNDRSAEALSSTVNEYSAIVDTTKVSDYKITAVAVVGDIFLAGTEKGDIIVMDRKHNVVSAVPIDVRVEAIAASYDGAHALVQSPTKLYFVELDSGGIHTLAQINVPVGRDDSIVAITTCASGSRYKVASASGKLWTYHYDGTNEGEIDLRSMGGFVLATSDESSFEVVDVGVVMANETEYVYIALSDHRLLRYDTNLRRIDSAGEIGNDSDGKIVDLCTHYGNVYVASTKTIFNYNQSSGDVGKHTFQGGQVHRIVVSDSMILVLNGGAVAPDTISRLSATDMSHIQNIPGTSIAAVDGIIAGTEDGRLVELGDAGISGKLADESATTANAFLNDDLMIRADASSVPFYSKGLTAIDLSDRSLFSGERPAVIKYNYSSEMSGEGGVFVNDIDVKGKYVAAVGDRANSRPSTLAVWDAENGGAPIAEIEIPDVYAGSSSQIDHVTVMGETGLFALHWSHQNRVSIWSIDSKTMVGEIDIEGEIKEIGYSSWSRSLVVLSCSSGSSQTEACVLGQYDAISGNKSQEFAVGEAIDFSMDDDGELFVLIEHGGGGSTGVRIVDQVGAEITSTTVPLVGVGINSSSNGERIAVVGDNGVIEVLDGRSLKRVTPPIDVGRNSFEVSWSSNSNLLSAITVTGSGGKYEPGSLVLFDFSNSSWGERACAIAGTGFSQSEWRDYTDGRVPYLDLCGT